MSMNPPMQVVIRGFAGKDLLFTERLEIEDPLSDEMAAVAQRHIELLAPHPVHMIEIEFLDEPDPLRRFFRVGTDPSGMVEPQELDFGGRA